MDLKWGWICLIIALCLRILVHGVIHSYGVFLANFSREIEDTKVATLAWVGAVAYGVVETGTPIALILVRKIGARNTVVIGVLAASTGLYLSGIAGNPRQLFFTYSLLTGSGMLLMNKPVFFLLDKYFPRDHEYHVLTTSVPRWSNSLGPLLFNPLSAALIGRIGWNMTFVTYGTLYLLVGGAGAYCIRDAPEATQEEAQEDTKDQRRHGESKLTESTGMFVVVCAGLLFFAAVFCWAFVVFDPTFILVKHMETLGFHESTGAFAVTVFSASDLVGRILITLPSDKLVKGRIVYLSAVCCFLLGIQNFFMGFSTGYALVLSYAIMAGFTTGLMGALKFPLCDEIMDGHYTHELFALSGLASGTALILGIVAAGEIFDTTGSYQTVFFLELGAFWMAALAFGAIVMLRNKVLRKSLPNTDEKMPLVASGQILEVPSTPVI
ncbi:monocarboxylate transporter 13-like [Lingula anatina]|uniref:Monocarboxylate transporter 13-like n=1 Tax=Lingula anatina TaxID=7574 RepID=A0A1S3JHH7_LINAN|nr:monocarboxylate transporter 13-like [Lingula anatina]|eukprot:XP_013409354.1 monocarboxylate transporter 13-like [Lingula anatina]